MRTGVIVRSDSWRVSGRSKGNDTGAGMGNSLPRFWLGAGGVILVHLILISISTIAGGMYGKFAKLHPLLFLLPNHRALLSRKNVHRFPSTKRSKPPDANLPIASVRTAALARSSIVGLASSGNRDYSTERAGFSYSILCLEPSGGIRHPRWDFPRPLRDARSQNPPTLYPTPSGRKRRSRKKDTSGTERGAPQKLRKA